MPNIITDSMDENEKGLCLMLNHSWNS